VDGNQIKKTTRRITTAMVFDYDMLNISILNIVDKQEIDPNTGEPSDNLPF
jgi:hypothetical protein